VVFEASESIYDGFRVTRRCALVYTIGFINLRNIVGGNVQKGVISSSIGIALCHSH